MGNFDLAICGEDWFGFHTRVTSFRGTHVEFKLADIRRTDAELHVAAQGTPTPQRIPKNQQDSQIWRIISQLLYEDFYVFYQN